MDFAIPISRFETGNVELVKQPTNKFSLGFSYKDGQFCNTPILLVLEPLKVVFIDWSKHQINLKEDENYMSFLSKFLAFQKNIHESLGKHAKEWLGESYSEDMSYFATQPLFKSGILTLYMSSALDSVTYVADQKEQNFLNETLQPGDLVRIVVKLYGVSLQKSESEIWTGKSRIQHSILQIYKVNHC
jgi:hypothetical protein